MRVVELCFHERDGRAAEMAARGLADAGLCVLRRPVTGGRIPAASPAAQVRVLLHSDALAALPDALAAFDATPVATTVAVPVGPQWPRRASRPWLIAPPRGGRLHAAAFWKLVAWAMAQPIADRDRRIAVQLALLRQLRGVSADAPAPRRRRRWRDAIELAELRPVRGAGDWESAVTPLAVAGTLVAAAVAAALFLDAATQPAAWSAPASAERVAVNAVR